MDFTDLVLLVGTNPLPNAVTARFFQTRINSITRVWLVYSEDNPNTGQKGTTFLADNIARVIRAVSPTLVVMKSGLTDVSSAAALDEDLLRLVEDIQAFSPGPIHLNYTGGTKAMAVHAYRSLERHFAEISYSYLDSRDFRLKLDGRETAFPYDLTGIVGISLEELLNLHNMAAERKKHDEGQERLKVLCAPVAQALDRSMVSMLGIQFKVKKKMQTAIHLYNKILDGKFLPDPAQADPDDWQKEWQQNFKPALEKAMRRNPDMVSMWAMLPSAPLLELPPLQSALARPLFSLPANLINAWKYYLPGIWLEDYVYRTIRNGLTQDSKLSELENRGLLSIEPNIKARAGGGNKEMELDGIFIKGYRLHNISCATSLDESTLKNKAFEAFFRAGQLGGDEARTVVVTPLASPGKQRVVKDLEVISGSQRKHLLILGADDLASSRLWNTLREYMIE